MKPTEIEPIDTGEKPDSPRLDRVNQLLLWAAFFLVAALAALVADIWLWPVSDGPIAQALGSTAQPTAAIATASSLPTSLPTATMPLTVAAVTATPVTPPPCVPPDDWGIHTVQEGNTLYSLSRRYGTDVDTLMRVNCLNTDTIFIGQRLYVPGPAATPTVPQPLSTPSPAASATPRLGASATPLVDALATPTRVPTATPQSAFQVNIPDRYLNIVLLGSDKRPTSGAWRTDSMIIVSVDLEQNVVRLLSLPRDLWVYIPGHGYNRINTADLWGELAKKGTGPDRVKQTIHYNLGIPIHYYVRVDFQGFMKIIDTVGGVDIDVDCPLSDIDLTAGIHHMNGQQALRYARSRYSTNDFDRGRRQRKVLMALWEQGLTMDIIPRLPSLWRTMSDSFQTDLPLSQVINLAYVGVQLKPQRILSKSIGPSHVQGWTTPEGAAVLLPREDRIRAMLENFYAVKDPNSLDTTSKVRVQILNGSPRREAEQLAAAALRWEGFKVVGTGTADRQDYAQTQIFVYNYNGDAMAGAEIAQALGAPPSAVQDLTSEPQGSDAANAADIRVILGRNYNPCQR